MASMLLKADLGNQYQPDNPQCEISKNNELLAVSEQKKYSIDVRAIDQDDALGNDSVRYNSNNHWTDNKPPADYRHVVDRNNTKHWIHLKHDFIRKVEIDVKKYKWLVEANEIGQYTGKFPNTFNDELDAMVEDYKNDFDISEFSDPVFVRTENVSLKTGQHGTLPYSNFRTIVQSLVSCNCHHTPFHKDITGNSDNEEDNQICLYLFEFKPEFEANKFNEFRVFVFENKVTCISQQNLYHRNTLFKRHPQLIEKYVNVIVDYHERVLKYQFGFGCYSLDMAVFSKKNKKKKDDVKEDVKEDEALEVDLPPDENVCLDEDEELEAYFIEINSFGKEYAAGSSLFHWIIDDALLCSDGTTVYFRYTV
jgi:hypothetical protein